MSFRNEEDALRSKVEGLETQLAKLAQENARLKRGASLEKVGKSPSAVIGAVVLIIAFILLAAGATRAALGRESISLILLLLLVPISGAAVLSLVLARCLHVAGPSEVLVLLGRKTPGPDGTLRGYRTVTGGRVLSVPLLERVERLSLLPLPVTLAVRGALTKDAKRVDLEAHAEARIAASEPALGRAVERFLGRAPEAVARAASEIVESAARGVLAGVTLEEAQRDRRGIERALVEACQTDLLKVGLSLERLVIDGIQPTRSAGPSARG